MRHQLLEKICILFAFGLSACIAGAADGPPRLRIDTSLYPYLDRVSNDTDLSFAINARLPARFSYFSYMNLSGVLSSGDVTLTRSEQNLRWAPSDKLPIDLAYQAVFVEDGSYDFSQIGPSWRVHDTLGLNEFFDRINLIYRVSFYLKRFSSDDDAWQMEHSFRMTFPGVSDRLYVGGFVDQIFDLPDSNPKTPIVTEVQAGVRFWKDFYAVAEYRINDFRQGNEHNLAVGVEYKYAWR